MRSIRDKFEPQPGRRGSLRIFPNGALACSPSGSLPAKAVLIVNACTPALSRLRLAAGFKIGGSLYPNRQ